MPTSPVPIQLGLFGCAEIAGMHVVRAHTRIRSDGAEAFVGEHLRWNRGKTHRPGGSPRVAPAPRLDHRMEEVELFPGAFQLPLWAA